MIKINNVAYACYFHQQNKSLPSLLMLHGFMGDNRIFNHLIDGLSKFCNPITIDLLGFGKSDKPIDPGRYSAHNQVKDLLGVIKQLKVNTLFLFGYSMGGRLALKTALAAPEHFNGLLLESTTCGITDKTACKERQKKDAARAEHIQQNFKQFLSEWKELDLFHSPLAPNKELVEKYQIIQSDQYPKALSGSLLGFGTGAMSPACEELKHLDIPVLLMAGTADKKYQQINKYLAEQFPNATFSSIEAGHRIHVDNPAVYTAELKNFIRNN